MIVSYIKNVYFRPEIKKSGDQFHIFSNLNYQHIKYIEKKEKNFEIKIYYNYYNKTLVKTIYTDNI